MRILIIGNSLGTGVLTDYLAENKDYLVFTTNENNSGNFVDISPDNILELKEFALANEINLVIVADPLLHGKDYLEEFNKSNITILTPDNEAQKIAAYKSYGKKFMYKNKINTPKFAFFEKPNLAIDYIKETGFPVVIKPDNHSPRQTAFIAETFGEAKRRIEDLFINDTKKVLIENYVFGKEITCYVISDGFTPFITGTVQSYRGEISINCTLDDETRDKIYNEIIFPTISNLAKDDIEYIGILGFDIIIDENNTAHLIEYNSFFKDIDAEIILKDADIEWAKVFTEAITGTLRDSFDGPFSIKHSEDFIASIYLRDEIVTEFSKTKNRLYERLLEDGLNKKDLDEAKRIWKI